MLHWRQSGKYPAKVKRVFKNVEKRDPFKAESIDTLKKVRLHCQAFAINLILVGVYYANDVHMYKVI